MLVILAWGDWENLIIGFVNIEYYAENFQHDKRTLELPILLWRLNKLKHSEPLYPLED